MWNNAPFCVGACCLAQPCGGEIKEIRLQWKNAKSAERNHIFGIWNEKSRADFLRRSGGTPHDVKMLQRFYGKRLASTIFGYLTEFGKAGILLLVYKKKRVTSGDDVMQEENG